MSDKNDKFQGLYFHGVLEGFEPTFSGEIDGNKYGASLKLNFSTIENVIKEKNGVKLVTPAKRNFKVSIPTTDEELPKLAEQWKQKLNKYMDIKLMPIKDGTYTMSNEDEAV